MSTETLMLTSDQDSLPDHMTFGFADGTTQEIDEYVADAQERLDKVALPHVEVGVELQGLVSEAVPYEPNEDDLERMKKDIRRMRIRAEQQRKRQFGKPILSLAIVYPKRQY